MLFDLVAERPHYRDHLLPIWNALPENARGIDWGTGPVPHGDSTLLVAGYSDLIRHPHRKCVYVEHGAGQAYLGMPLEVAPYYSPLVRTKQHRNVIMFLCPNDEVAARWSRSYDRPAVVVGCPKLDPWHAGLRGKPEPRTVAITFHWEPPASVWAKVPELRSGFSEYFPVIQDTLERFHKQGWQVICHGHPRATALYNFWRETEIQCPTIEIVESGTEVIDRAALLVADNTSLQAEFMSLGRGVVWLNHPAYRKDVEHGGRFWQWPERSGVSINSPRDLLQLDLASVEPSTWHPYAYADGHSTERAVEAILSISS